MSETSQLARQLARARIDGLLSNLPNGAARTYARTALTKVDSGDFSSALAVLTAALGVYASTTASYGQIAAAIAAVEAADAEVNNFCGEWIRGHALNWFNVRLFGQTAGAASQNLFAVRNDSLKQYLRSQTWFGYRLDLSGMAVSGVHLSMVSPIHFITASHITPAVGALVRFLGNDGAVIERRVAASVQVAGTDVRAGILDSELPVSVRPFKVLTGSQQLAMSGLSQNGGSSCNMLTIDQNFQAKVGAFQVLVETDTADIGLYQPKNFQTFYGVGISGDSGQPWLTVIRNTPVLVGVFHTPSGCGNIAGQYAAINTALGTLGGGYQLSSFDIPNVFDLNDGETPNRLGQIPTLTDRGGTFLIDGNIQEQPPSTIVNEFNGIASVYIDNSEDAEVLTFENFADVAIPANQDKFRTALGFLTNSAALDFGSTAAQTHTDLTITVTGAAVGDVVLLGVPNGSVLAGVSYSAWVSASNTVTVRLNNYSSTAKDPASGTFKATVIH